MGNEIKSCVRIGIECIEILVPTNPKIQSGDKMGISHPATTLLKYIIELILLINENGEIKKVKKTMRDKYKVDRKRNIFDRV
jgi:hypothetical protein